MFCQVLKFWQIWSRDFGVLGFKFRGVCITSNFHRPLAARLCVIGEHDLEVQERYGPPLSPCQVWRGSDIAHRHVAEKFDVFCLFVCHTFK